jgi:Abnormal spindle-like microcephaly-assoc'd, ASPM-SPD-2-Hydin
MKIGLALLPLFASSFLLAQHLRPTALTFEAVPPNTSPQEIIAFTNNGTAPLSLAVSVNAPFSIAENRCANGVKPGTHCNVYLTYTPTSVGQVDNGTLTFNYGDGIVTAPLNGHGVSAIPTDVTMSLPQCKIVNLGGDVPMIAKVRVPDKYYALPTGEQVHASCSNGQVNVDLGVQALTLCKRGEGCGGRPYDHAFFDITPDQTGNWSCRVTYDGNGILASGVGVATFQIVDGGGHCH